MKASKWLTNCIANNSLSVSKIAKRAGCSYEMVRQVAKGIANPSKELFDKLVTAVGLETVTSVTASAAQVRGVLSKKQAARRAMKSRGRKAAAKQIAKPTPAAVDQSPIPVVVIFGTTLGGPVATEHSN